MSNTNGQQNQTTEALNYLQQVINAATKGGLFSNTAAVANAQASLDIVGAEIQKLKTEKDSSKEKVSV